LCRREATKNMTGVEKISYKPGPAPRYYLAIKRLSG
jgi:hypothetical protein